VLDKRDSTIEPCRRESSCPRLEALISAKCDIAGSASRPRSVKGLAVGWSVWKCSRRPARDGFPETVERTARARARPGFFSRWVERHPLNDARTAGTTCRVGHAPFSAAKPKLIRITCRRFGRPSNFNGGGGGVPRRQGRKTFRLNWRLAFA